MSHPDPQVPVIFKVTGTFRIKRPFSTKNEEINVNNHSKKSPRPTQLQIRWIAICLFYLLAVFVIFGMLEKSAFSRYANQWLMQTAVFLTYTLAIVWRHLHENHRVGETAVLPTFGLGNQLTMLRGLLVSMLAGFLFIPQPVGWLAWLPALLYTAASIADILDGYAARVSNHATALGARLDMAFDGLGILLVIALAVWYGQLPFIYITIGLARYFFLLGLWLRAKIGLQNHAMSASVHRRVFAGLQMGFISVVLWPILPTSGVSIAALFFGSATAVSFLRDWFVVVGWLDPQSPVYRQWQSRLTQLFSTQLPPLLRLIFAICAIILAQTMPTGWADLFAAWQFRTPPFFVTFFIVTGLLAAAALVAGAMGRVMALWLLFPLAFDMITNGTTVANGVAVGCVVLIALLGTGAYSIWQPEDNFLYRRLGA